MLDRDTLNDIVLVGGNKREPEDSAKKTPREGLGEQLVLLLADEHLQRYF